MSKLFTGLYLSEWADSVEMKDNTIKYRAPHIRRHLSDVKCCHGDSVTFECEVEDENSSNINFHWYRSGELIPHIGNEFQVSVTGNVARLHIQQVYCEDGGQYSCIVSNVYGLATSSACLIVNAPEEKRNLICRRRVEQQQIEKASTSGQSRSGFSLSTYRVPSKEKENSCAPKFIPAKFNVLPNNKIVHEGETVRFECAVIGHPTPSVVWSRCNVDITSAPDNSRVSVNELDNLRFLEITNVTVDDEGLYKVVVQNEYGHVEAAARLDVIDRGRKNENGANDRAFEKHYANCAKSKLASAGGKCVICCNVPGACSEGSATWYKNGELLRLCSSILSKNSDTAFQLHFKNLTVDDSGVYTCIVESNFGKTRCSVELLVLDDFNISNMNLQPPIFVAGIPSKTFVVEGKSFEFRVKLQGISPLRVTWFKNDKELPNCKDFEYVNYGYGEYGLMFKDTFVADSGLYKCEARNQDGEAQTVGHLVIEETPVELNIKTSEEIESCRICKNGNGVRNGSSTICNVEIVDNFHNDFEYDDIPLGNGTDSTDFLPEIYNKTVPPYDDSTPATVIEGPADKAILRYETALLTVRYFGNPEPIVKWMKAGRELTSNNRISVTSKNGESILQIKKVTADDGGKYLVRVENESGADAHITSLAVEGPPDCPSSQPYTVAGDRSATVTWCSPAYDGGSQVTGYTIEMRSYANPQWRKVVENCHSLYCTVRGLKPGESYLFRIRAENVHGLSGPSLESIPTYITHADVCLPIEQKRINIQNGELFTTQYDVLEELGKGRYGVVHKIRDKEFGNFYAAKYVRCVKSKDKEKVREEVAIMNILTHPKLLQLIAAYESPKEILIVTEYISGGELFERVVADDFTLTERDCILFMRQTCEGVAYIHRNNVVHLDLKPENIMCVSRNSHQIKLIDFGLAQKISPDTPIRVLFGTPEFIPPEIINYEPIGTESDMWSVGIICYVLLSGLSPFMGENNVETFANITRAEYDFDDEAFDAISEDAKDFISSLLIKRKEKRLTAKQCLHHKWLAQHDKTMSCVKLCTDKLKGFIIRRKWQKTGNAIRALGRLTTLSASSRRSSSTNSRSSNSPRVSLVSTYSSRVSSLGEDDVLLPAANGRDVNESIIVDTPVDEKQTCNLEVPPTRNTYRKSVAFKETTLCSEVENTISVDGTKNQTLTTVPRISALKKNSNEEEGGSCNVDVGIEFDSANFKNGNSKKSSSTENKLVASNDIYSFKRSVEVGLNSKMSTEISTISSNLNISRIGKNHIPTGGVKIRKSADTAKVKNKAAERLKKFEQLSFSTNCATGTIKEPALVCNKNNFQKAVAFWNRE